MTRLQEKSGYQYQHIYEGRFVSLIPFAVKAEAIAHYRMQSKGLGPNDANRLRVINPRTSRPVCDTWGVS